MTYNQKISIEIEDNGEETEPKNDMLLDFDDDELMERINLGSMMITDTFLAKQIEYQENYVMTDLKKIADYYDISWRKMRKDELVQSIVLYECDPNNEEIYMRRIQAWYWLNELKEDPRLKQYVLF
jgi:hypothetical protein